MSEVSHRPPDHPAVPARRIGVLLVNLGTPDATDYWSMRRYLKEFLSDRRVIEENRLKWWLVLNLIILTVRPGRKGRDYDKIWNKERNESPLKTITRSQSDKLAAMLGKVDRACASTGRCATAIRRSARGSRRCAAQDCDRILVVPLYPQYAAATTATVCDEVFRALAKHALAAGACAWPRLLRRAGLYRRACRLAQAGLAKLDFKPDVIVASFHGMPEEYVPRAIPIIATAPRPRALLRERLKLDEEGLMMTFQSRFGPAEWLKPYTDATMKALAERGVKNLAVIMPGFAADCLETLEEIAMENAAIFSCAGGENFAGIPCLNDGPGRHGGDPRRGAARA